MYLKGPPLEGENQIEEEKPKNLSYDTDSGQLFMDDFTEVEKWLRAKGVSEVHIHYAKQKHCNKDIEKLELEKRKKFEALEK